VTLIEGAAIRTGVTAILPAGHDAPLKRLPGGFSSLNGNGEMTGTHWLEEAGMLEGPVMLTNTNSVGIVRDATAAWLVRRAGAGLDFALPVVAETFDGALNDINGHHVTTAHAHAALDGAKAGPVAEGCVGGGTGMITHEWKGGIGTASRRVAYCGRDYAVGVLVQSNYGLRSQLTIAGVPVGREIAHSMPQIRKVRDGSIIACIATDLPLLPHQCKRLARRAAMGLARVGSVARDSSGDIFIAFSTAAPETEDGFAVWRTLPSGDPISPMFQAVVEATEEAIVNALVAAETMVGIHGNIVHALPHDELQQVLARYNRLAMPQ
jgi:D-aminopeptidase